MLAVVVFSFTSFVWYSVISCADGFEFNDSKIPHPEIITLMKRLAENVAHVYQTSTEVLGRAWPRDCLPIGNHPAHPIT